MCGVIGNVRGHARLLKRLKLAALAVLGLCTASIPVTIAIVLSATGTSDVLTLGSIASEPSDTTPAQAVARMRCVSERGHYALTFEDGPFPDTTPRLVAALEQAHAVATFFDVGRRAAAHPDLVDLQRGVGQVANHSYTHPRLVRVSGARRVQELQATAKVLRYPNVFFRPPYGETDQETDRDIARSGLTSVYWTVDTGDADGARTDDIVARALRVQPGGIVLLHDSVDASIDAVPRIVAGLEKRGMCPGFLARTGATVRGANGLPFHAIAAKP